jgi:hypothetical protein
MTLFNKIEVRRYDDNGTVSKSLEVPIKFGPLSKYYMRRTEDGEMKRYYVQLPAMAVTINGFNYSQERAVSTKQTRLLRDPNDAESFLSDIMPAPWDVEFTLHIRSESFMDFTQIVEQIIPFFNPSVHLRVKEFNSVNIERDIRVTLNGFNNEFSEETEEEGKRFINGQLTFTADAWFYKPISDAKVIDKIYTKYGFDPRHNMFDYFNTSGVNISATSAIETTGSTTTGDLPEYDDKGYINLSPEE